MSAWPVSDREIDCLAYWISPLGLGLSKRTPESIGKELRAENYKSLRARYGYYSEYQKAPKYTFHRPEPSTSRRGDYNPYNIDQILKMVHFYDYQSCEHWGAWEKSQSYRWMKRLEEILIEQGADWQREGLTWGAA
jgi:hypothetical protein